MEKSNFPERLVIPRPFASGDKSSIKPIEIDSSSDNPNFINGFPQTYSSIVGKYVTREELNAIGNLASANEFYRACGGLNTFDPAIASSIGGYPKGAILKYVDGTTIYDVVSLTDNNRYNFNESGIDGENWEYANRNSMIKTHLVHTITGGYKGLDDGFGISRKYNLYTTYIFKSEYEGLLTASGTAKYTKYIDPNKENTAFKSSAWVCAKEFDSREEAESYINSRNDPFSVISVIVAGQYYYTSSIDPTNYHNRKYTVQVLIGQSLSQNTQVTITGGMDGINPITPFICHKNKYYRIFLASCDGLISDANIEVRIQE